MENPSETENPPTYPTGSLSESKQRFKLSALEILFGSLIVVGLLYMGYFILFQESPGSVLKIEKKIKSLETGTQEQGEKIDKRIKGIQDSQVQLESRLKALEATNQNLLAKVEKMEKGVAEEKKPSPASPKKEKIQYKVKKGETLRSIAKKFKVSSNELIQWNKLNRNKALNPGDVLVIFPR